MDPFVEYAADQKGLEVVGLKQYAARLRLEGAVMNAGRPYRICIALELFAPVAIRIVSDDQIA
jgi:hypothetical protein